MKKLLSLLFVSLALVGAGCGSSSDADVAGNVADEMEAAKISASVVETKLGNAGIAFTKQDDTAKRTAMFAENNQVAVEALTKFKFGGSSVQLSVIDLNDASRKGFVNGDVLALYNQVKAADANYTRSYALLSAEDEDTVLLMIYKPEDQTLAGQIEAAL